MSNDQPILMNNQEFTIEMVFNNETRKGTLTTTRFIGSGEVVQVFEVTDTSKKQYALKIPKDPSRVKLVQDEFEMLRELEAQHKLRNPNAPINTPMGNYFVTVHINPSTSVKGLLMPFLSFPQLADYYRGSQNRAGDKLNGRLHAEYIAWYAAVQYLDLIQTQLTMKKITTDRKRDTFLWDDADNRLVVMDWNVMDEVKPTSEGEALYNFGQVWFTMFTQLQAQAIPTFWDDERWDNLSLGGRDILLALLRRDILTVPDAKKRVKSYATQLNDALSNRAEMSLSPDFRSYLTAWDDRPKPLTRKVVEDQFKPLVYLADILRRVDGGLQKQAQTIYDEAHQAIEVRGELSERQFSVQRNLEKVKAYRISHLNNINDQAFLDLREDLLTLMSQHDALKTKLYALEAAFQSIPNDFNKRRIQAQEMRERLDDVKKSLEIYGVEDKQLARFYGECDVIDLAYQADDALAYGNGVGALELYEELRIMHSKYPLEKYTHLTIEAVEGIIALLNAIEGRDTPNKTDPRYIVKTVSQKFIEFVEEPDGELIVWVKKWKSARLSSQLTVYDKLLLEDYIRYADLIQTAHQTEFVRGEASHYLAYELGRLYRRLPRSAVKRSINQSVFYKTLLRHMEDAYAKRDEVNRERVEDRHLYALYHEDAHYLSQLALMIKG